MKKLIYLSFLIFTSKLAFAQNMNVGINTDNPKETLHVKGTMRFEPAVSTTNPAAAANKILTSDANGTATWRNVALPVNNAITATYGTGTNVTRTGSGISSAYATGTSITLPPGTWIVSFAMDVNVTMNDGTAMSKNKAVWVRSSLFNSTTTEDYTASSGDIQDRPLISKEITGPATHTMMIGEFTVRNSGSANKTYYYKVSIENAGFGSNETSKLNLFGRGPESVATNRLVATIAKYPTE